MRQNLVLFFEPSEDKWRCPLKIGSLYMNRFVINEKTANEIISINELRPTKLIPWISNEMDPVTKDKILHCNKELLQKRNLKERFC